MQDVSPPQAHNTIPWMHEIDAKAGKAEDLNFDSPVHQSARIMHDHSLDTLPPYDSSG